MNHGTAPSLRHSALALLATASIFLSMHQAAEAKTIGPTAAAILGGVAGLAVGAAIADANHHNNRRIYYEGYQQPYPPGGYDAYFNRSFSPAPRVVCYPAQRLCYDANGTVAHKWTRRIYGY
ncbi:hypothetical protein [Aestuariivirga sp.]|uniref:hypothetical protein n=1 Tax=Aestuariivirga sp. TaxID=2650926 RepID=UPI003BAB12AC